MRVLCEVLITDLFRLSSGDVAIIGRFVPDVECFIPSNSKADLYLGEKKIKTINIVGEDRFSGIDERKKQGRRSVRTDSDIPKDLNISDSARLVIFE